jgi:alpha-L-rhamnosidase
VTEVRPSRQCSPRSTPRATSAAVTVAAASEKLHWIAKMITSRAPEDSSIRLRAEVARAHTHGTPIAAHLHVTSLGIFEAAIDGVAVDDDLYSPGWSSYEWRLRYRTYDVLAQIRDRFVLSMVIGNGWWRGRRGWTGHKALYGDRLAGAMQLEVRYADGDVETVATDERWTALSTEIVANDFYDGQTVDARLISDDWMRIGGGAGSGPVEELNFSFDVLTPYVGPPVRRQDVLHPVNVWKSPSGKMLVDFGQNLVGFVRFTVQAPRGSVITIRHAEVLEHGELCLRPLRSAQATDRLICSGAEDRFEPTMTCHGFRYVEVSGWPDERIEDHIEAVVVHSDLERIGHFECSNAALNRLHENIVWGLKGNFVDLPTDSPQRDGRLGWTGDIAVFAPSATFLFDVDTFLQDWLLDLAAEQGSASGVVPFVVPNAFKFMPELTAPGAEVFGGLNLQETPTALWGDAAVWVPWALWRAYGNRAVLSTQYPSMAAHVRHAESRLSASDLWDTGFQFGDWLDPTAPADRPFDAKADGGVIATACLIRSARIVARTAELTGRSVEAAHFDRLADRITAAFNRHYVADDGRIFSDAPAVYAIAICFDILQPVNTQAAGRRLAELVAASDHHIASGFAGTPFVADALTRTGHLADAYQLLLQASPPSWLYEVEMGATTIWERWDAMLPNGDINPSGMTSFNHYAFGAVADWMHRVIGGIAPLEPGYERVLVAPQPGGGLTSARSSVRTRHGVIRVAWAHSAEQFIVEAELPHGVTGVLQIAGIPDRELTSGASRHCGQL